MSAPKVIAQAAGLPLISFPTWKCPVLLHLRAAVAGGAGVIAVVADQDAVTGDVGTTPGISITRESAGIYLVTFDPCRSCAWGTWVCNVLPDSAFATANNRQAALDRTDANTSAKLGKLRVGFYTGPGGAVATELPDLAEVHMSWWADFG